MRVEIITCDNCGGPIASARGVVEVLGREWCASCADIAGSRDLVGVPFASWPIVLRRADVRRWLEYRDAHSSDAERELRSLRDRLALRDRELATLRETAADGYASGDMAATLADIASNARRREPNRIVL